jgi:hypothetical protein
MKLNDILSLGFLRSLCIILLAAFPYFLSSLIRYIDSHLIHNENQYSKVFIIVEVSDYILKPFDITSAMPLRKPLRGFTRFSIDIEQSAFTTS